MVYQDHIHEKHIPIIHEKEKEIIHEKHVPIVHEKHTKKIEEEYRDAIIKEKIESPRKYKEKEKTVVEKEYLDKKFVKDSPNKKVEYIKESSAPHAHVDYLPGESYNLPAREGYGTKLKNMFKKATGRRTDVVYEGARAEPCEKVEEKYVYEAKH